tara:strand:+ start:560 stop:2125 length:1566 start_codon:yes stop_codon:yes gene_type:complete
MVSSIYTPNKRIDYYRNLSRALMPKRISAYNPNDPNPYAQTASTNLANVLRGLVDTYSAQQQLGKAEQLEAEQLAAQRAIGSQFAQMRTPGTGPTLDITETAMPISDMDMVQRRQPRVSRRPFSMDALEIPLELQEAAGTTPELLQGRIAEITAGRKEAYTARQEAEIDRRLGSIAAAIAITGEGPERERLQNQRSQLLAIKDAAKTAVRQETRETARAKEERGVAREEAKAGDVPRKVFDTDTLEMVMIPTREWRANRDRYKAEMPKTVDVVELATGKTTQITKKMLLQDIARGQAGEDRKYGSRRGISLVDGQLVQGAQPIGKTQTQKEVKKRVETGFHVARAGSLLRKITDTPGLTGLRGRAAELAGGVVGQVYAPLGRVVAEVISGASPEQLAEYRVAAKALIAGLIEEMTGEESGRFSEPERRIAETSVAALEKLSSAEQVGGAVRAAMKAYIVHGAKSDFLLGKPYDLKDKKWLIKYGTELKKLGLEGDDIKDVLAQIRSAYRFLDWDKDSRRKE